MALFVLFIPETLLFGLIVLVHNDILNGALTTCSFRGFRGSYFRASCPSHRCNDVAQCSHDWQTLGSWTVESSLWWNIEHYGELTAAAQIFQDQHPVICSSGTGLCPRWSARFFITKLTNAISYRWNIDQHIKKSWSMDLSNAPNMYMKP